MAVMGRPTEFDPETVREIRLPLFPETLDDRFKKMCKDRGEKQIDMVRGIIAKELDAKFVTKPPLETKKKEKLINRKFRNISVEDWAKFQARAFHYGDTATDLLMQLINLEVLRHEKQKELISDYQKKFDPEVSGTINFTWKLPRKTLDAVVLFGKDHSLTVNSIVHGAIKKIDDSEFQEIGEFNDNGKEKIVQRRLFGINRKLWVEFRKFCIAKKLNTNRTLIAFVRFDILRAYRADQGDGRNKKKIINLLN